MKRILVILIVIAFIPMSAMASKLERGLRSRWLGAWVVMTVETYSNCSGRFTANRVNGRLVSSRGRQRFRRGELARVERIDAKRRRIDIFLSIAEPVLVSYEDGPFTLYNEANCKLELEVEVPRELVKSKDVRSLDRALAPLMKRFSDIDDAQNADSWNQRERDAYPEGYDRTLARHAIWQAERQNALVQTRLDDAFNKTAEITSRIGSDEPYLSGFARGGQGGPQQGSGELFQAPGGEVQSRQAEGLTRQQRLVRDVPAHAQGVQRRQAPGVQPGDAA